EAAWRNAKGEVDVLLLDRQPVEPEPALEAHAAGLEGEIRGSHAERRGGDRDDAARSAAPEDLATSIESEEIEGVDIDIDAIEKGVEVAVIDPLLKQHDIELRIDVARMCSHGRNLGVTQGRHRGTGLAVEVRQLEPVEIGEMESADAEPRQRDQVRAADAAHSR